jgi:cupin 2 domain-containing protein
MEKNNIFENINVPEYGEIFEILLKNKNIIIERIISSDKVEPKEYIQEQDEWVIVSKGKAKLEINGEILNLKEGDYIFIPSNTPHKVLETEKGTIWIAVHIY